MISYTLTNSTFDIGTRSGSSSCDGLFGEMADLYARNIIPQLKMTHETDSSTVECLLAFVGKQTIGDAESFIFQNGLVSVIVDDEDNVNTTKVFDLNGITYLDTTKGDFILNTDAFRGGDGANLYANVGNQVVMVSVSGDVRNINAIAANSRTKLCDISPSAKAIIGSTYIECTFPIGAGKVAKLLVNTWEDNSYIEFVNSSGAQVNANTTFAGSIMFMRTL